jgi:hypothetical protein
MGRYEQMRGGQAAVQPVQSTMVPINESVQLPPLAPRSAPLRSQP